MRTVRVRSCERLIMGELLEVRFALSAVGFVSHEVFQGARHRLDWTVITADVDGDGDYDVLSSSSDDHKIAWYENTDGKATFGPQRVIATSAVWASFVHAADIDGDGDVDVLSAAEGEQGDYPGTKDDEIAWYENSDGTGVFGAKQVISTDVEFAQTVFTADFDADGDADVLSASSGIDARVAWYENVDGEGAFGPQMLITAETSSLRSVFATDVDGDGDVDVFSASDKIAWSENSDGFGDFGRQQVISTEADSAWSVHAADVDGDGDVDAVAAMASQNGIIWFENQDGKGSFGPAREISTEGDKAYSVFTADVDADGDTDVLSASLSRQDSKIVWYENTDGLGTFGQQQVIMATRTVANVSVRTVHAADLDGDGDVDVVSAWTDRVRWFENRLSGDVDDDGKVSFKDFLILAANFGNRDAVWEDGDFDGNARVEDADFLILADNFGKSRPTVVAPTLSRHR